jgi:hypothetical protein
MTKQDRRLIAKVAKTLPKMVHQTETVKLAMRGQSLINHGVPELKNGDTVNPNKLYLAAKGVPKEINHRKELEKMFLKYGDVGIASYQKKILELNQSHANQTN